MDKKIKVIGNAIEKIEKAIIKYMKNEGVNYKYDTFRRVMGVNPDDIIPEDEHHVLVHVHSGSNEGYYIMIGTVKMATITNYFLFRFNTSLEEVIEVQTDLLRILQI